MRVLITGSRNWTDPDAIWRVLDVVADECQDGVLYVRHGGCEDGADQAAHVWAGSQQRVYLVEEICRAPWQLLGKRAGFWRNNWMTEHDVIDRCIAFMALCIKPDCDRYAEPKAHYSHGTQQCANRAVRQRIPTWRYYA